MKDNIQIIVDWVQDTYEGTIETPNFDRVADQLREFKKVEITEQEYKEAEMSFELFSCEGCGWTCSTDEMHDDGYCDECASDLDEE